VELSSFNPAINRSGGDSGQRRRLVRVDHFRLRGAVLAPGLNAWPTPVKYSKFVCFNGN
jgi:hypothetical protein